MPNTHVTIGDTVVDRDSDSSDHAIVVNKPPVPANEWEAYDGVTVAEDNPDYPKESRIAVVSFADELGERASELQPVENPIPIASLSQHGVSYYAFPVDRLRIIEDEPPASETASTATSPDENVTDHAADTDHTATDSPSDTQSTATEREANSADEDTVVDSEKVEHEVDEEDEEDETEQLPPALQSLLQYLHENGVEPHVGEDVLIVEKLGQQYRITEQRDVEGEGPHREQLVELVREAPATD